LPHRVVRRGLDHRLGPRGGQRLQPDHERHAVGRGKRPALRRLAAPGEGDDLQVAQRTVAQVLQDQARDDAAADEADTHAFPSAPILP
jgi:hypothetical protein